jgi:hypothetical protein
MGTKPGRGRIPARGDRRAIGRGGPRRVPTSVGPEHLGVDLAFRIANPRRLDRAWTIAGRARRSIAVRRRGLLARSRDSGQHPRLDSSNVGPLGPGGIARDISDAPDDHRPARGRGGEVPTLIDSDRTTASLITLLSLTSRNAVGRFAFALAAIVHSPHWAGRHPSFPPRGHRAPDRDHRPSGVIAELLT